MRAAKGNKEYMIDETQQKFYQDSGFDILDDAGAAIAYGRGKTIPYNEYMEAVKEIERLQGLAAEGHAEIEALKAEIAVLQAAEKKEKAPAKKAGE